MVDLLAPAHRYRFEFGWSTFPVVGKEPKAGFPWARFQLRRPSDANISEWFADGHGFTGLAIIPGDVSGGLAIRDFDDPAAYKAWYDRYPELADVLPRVQTSRGSHVYCRAAPGSLASVRKALGCDGRGAIPFDDGELRADSGCYCVAPPSIHPDGGEYRWVVAPRGKLPEVDLLKSGFIPPASRRKTHSTRSDTQAMLGVAVSAVCPTLPDGVSAAIVATLPIEKGQRNRLLFKLAQKLRAVPELANKDVLQAKPIVQKWHQFALPIIGTKAWDATWSDFVTAWERIRNPSGTEPIRRMFQEAIEMELPAAALQYDTPELRALVALCRRLQIEAGNKPFFLAGRAAAEMIGASHKQTAQWLRMLVVDHVLALATVGTRHHAAEYRFIGDA